MRTQYNLHMFGNLIAIFFIYAVLLVAFYEQFVVRFLPCPLCFIQRLAYIIAGLAVCLNLQRGPRPYYYGIFIVACALGEITSLRQVLLHINEDGTGYGDRVLGLYAYSWNAIIFFILMVVGALALLFNRPFNQGVVVTTSNRFYRVFTLGLVLMIVVNIFSVFSICGIGSCPEDPNEGHIPHQPTLTP